MVITCDRIMVIYKPVLRGHNVHIKTYGRQHRRKGGTGNEKRSQQQKDVQHMLLSNAFPPGMYNEWRPSVKDAPEFSETQNVIDMTFARGSI